MEGGCCPRPSGIGIGAAHFQRRSGGPPVSAHLRIRVAMGCAPGSVWVSSVPVQRAGGDLSKRSDSSAGCLLCFIGGPAGFYPYSARDGWSAFPGGAGPFAAEHGVMAGWLVCLAAMLSGKRPVATDPRVRIFAWIYGMLPMASLALWVSLAGPGKAMRGLPVADWGRNALYFLQGLIIPLPQAIPAAGRPGPRRWPYWG